MSDCTRNNCGFDFRVRKPLYFKYLSCSLVKVKTVLDFVIKHKMSLFVSCQVYVTKCFIVILVCISNMKRKTRYLSLSYFITQVIYY